MKQRVSPAVAALIIALIAGAVGFVYWRTWNHYEPTFSLANNPGGSMVGSGGTKRQRPSFVPPTGRKATAPPAGNKGAPDAKK